MQDVIVVGAGPTGMMLAAELTLAGAPVRLLDRRAVTDATGSRAGGFHSRTLEILDQRGIVDRFLEAGQAVQTARMASTVLDASDLPTRHPYGLALWQSLIEPLLAEWITELGVRVERGPGVVGVEQDDAGVDVALEDGTVHRAGWLVGADGGRSTIRKAAGIGFPGWDATRSTLIAEVQVREQPPAGMRQDEAGVHGLLPLEDGRTYRVVTTERTLRTGAEPTLDDLRTSLAAVFGTDFGVHEPTWLSRFTDATRQADRYRAGRILLAGDAAHIHYPAGGQGIGLGIQDAVNLGWKLAQVALGRSDESLLDTYHAERHPADARALRLSMAQTATQRTDPRTEALDELLDDLLSTTPAQQLAAARVHGLDVVYDLGPGHPMLGRRMPDLDLETSDGPTRVYRLLTDARPLLLDPEGRFRAEAAPWTDRLRIVQAALPPVRLPLLDAVPEPGAVLVRPDGHVAWTEVDEPEPLTAALARWLGPRPVV